jgi:hypothetical protein
VLRYFWTSGIFALCATAAAAPPTTAAGTNAADPPPTTPITLRLKDEPVESAFEQFARAANIRFTTNSPQFWGRAGDRTVTLDADHAPFWRVLSDLCAAAGLLPLHSADGTVDLIGDGNGWSVEPSSIQGPFLVHAAGVESSRTILLGRTPRRTSRCLVSLNLSAEPGVHATFIDEAKFTALDGGDGNPITRKPSPIPLKNEFHQGIAWVPISLDPRPDVHVIKRLDATFTVVVVTQTKTLDVPEIMKAQKLVREFEDLTITLTAHPAEGGCDVAALVHYNGKDTARWQHIEGSLRVITPRVLDAQGREYQRPSVGSGGADRGDIEFRISYRTTPGAPANPGPPDRLTWDIPTAFADVLVPVHFKDLPLP